MGRAFEVRKAAMAKTAAAKTKVYSRYGKEIYLAAKNGEPNPEMNLELSRIIDKAKADQVPNDIIKRAIEKAKGGIDEHYDAIRYEGFGPGSSTLIIDALTNNTNRTFGEVRNCFTKTNTKIGVSNSVSYLYNHVGILTFNFNDEDSVLETLILNDVDVVEIESEEDLISVLVNPKDLYLAKETLEKELHIKQYETLELSMIPLDFVTLDNQQMEVFNKLISMLEDCEDVSHIYHNVSL